METIVRTVDDRNLVLGLDQMYRDQMKGFETGKLLECVREVLKTLDETPSRDIPVEGYYSEREDLKEYFYGIRHLQNVSVESRPKVDGLESFQKLLKVVSSPIFGKAESVQFLLPRSRTSLDRALDSLPGQESLLREISVESIIQQGKEIAQRTQDSSLVGLALQTGDPVIVAACRESVALYNELLIMAAACEPTYVYEWNVSSEIEQLAQRFVRQLEEATGIRLPLPGPETAERYWHESGENDFRGRCIALAQHPTLGWYHWAIYYDGDAEEYQIQAFWAKKLWTTDIYKKGISKNLYRGESVPQDRIEEMSIEV
jgi:hypothetical protein